VPHLKQRKSTCIVLLQVLPLIHVMCLSYLGIELPLEPARLQPHTTELSSHGSM
jgi:hypothetical protein